MKNIPMGCREFNSCSDSERLGFAKEFVGELSQSAVPRKGMNRCTDWTNAIREWFRLACPEDCEYAVRSRPQSSKEYLVDLSWMERNDGKRVLLGVCRG